MLPANMDRQAQGLIKEHMRAAAFRSLSAGVKPSQSHEQSMGAMRCHPTENG